jgi:dihydroanticapsin dehydrogenase
MELSGKVALVTGGNSGIGRAISKLFAKEGAKVVIGDIHPGETVDEIKSEGGTCIFVEMDVRVNDDAKRLVDAAIHEYGKLDIVCNNAGIELIQRLVETTEDEWNKVLDTNLKGVFLVSRYALRYLIEQKNGVVVNVASQLGIVGSERWGAYCASKAGVILLTKVIALEYAKYNIRANCVCPGSIYTPLVERELGLERDPKLAKEIMISQHPIGRLGTPEEIAQAVLFLASSRSSFVTGTALVADGGYTIL